MLALDRLASVFICLLLGIMKVSTYPSPKPTFTLTCLLRQNVGLGRGRKQIQIKGDVLNQSRSKVVPQSKLPAGLYA